MKPLFLEFFYFGINNLRSCKFAATFFCFLVISQYFTCGLPRYDFLFIAMLLAQIIFVALKIESLDELKVICCFHVIGLLFELFKTQPAINSWSYPEEAFFKISTVPLYSGFMYASVASYVIQSWRILKIKIKKYPPAFLTLSIGVLIYAHFFLKYLGVDLRWPLVIAVFILYLRTHVSFMTYQRRRELPLSIGFALVGFFIWIAENIATFFGAWQYPHQLGQWQIVHNTKIGAWFLLYIVSFIVVTQLKVFKKSSNPRAGAWLILRIFLLLP